MKNKFRFTWFIVVILLSIALFPSLTATASCYHSWSIWASVKPTCESDGFEAKVCDYCPAYLSVDLPATGHSWSEWGITEPTCGDNIARYRYCFDCDAEEEIAIPPIGNHSWGRWKTIYKSSCFETGRKERVCNNCLKEEAIKIPAIGKHNWRKWSIVKKSSFSGSGLRKRTCKVCKTSQSKSIPKKKATRNEQLIINEIKSYITYAKRYDTPKLKSCFVTSPQNAFFDNKQYMINYCRKYNKRISYSIEDISVKGQSANVKLRVESPDGYDIFYQTFDDLFKFFLYRPDVAEKESGDYLIERIKRNTIINGGITFKKRTVTFSYIKTNRGWKISRASQPICDIANCMYTKAHSDYFK